MTEQEMNFLAHGSMWDERASRFTPLSPFVVASCSEITPNGKRESTALQIHRSPQSGNFGTGCALS